MKTVAILYTFVLMMVLIPETLVANTGHVLTIDPSNDHEMPLYRRFVKSDLFILPETNCLTCVKFIHSFYKTFDKISTIFSAPLPSP